MMAGRHAHAKQFNRHRKQLRILQSWLGRIIRDISRKIAGHAPISRRYPNGRSLSPARSVPSSSVQMTRRL